MPLRFSVLGGDARQRYLALSLCSRGYPVSPLAVPGLEDDPRWEAGDVIILPIPSRDAQDRISGTGLSAAELARKLSPAVRVFGGKLGDTAAVFPRYEDCLSWPELAEANAIPTAEGAIQLAMEALPVTVHKNRFLVIGAGRIGTALTRRLLALGGEVTLCARREESMEEIAGLGARPEKTGVYRCGLGDYVCIFNTVPSPVLTPAQLRETDPACIYIELASAPGGCSPEQCAAAGRQYLAGGGLPGRVAPKTAGELLARSILSHLGLPM